MTIANDIINGQIPDFQAYLAQGESLDDIDEYGFTPLIEAAITKQPDIARLLIEQGVNINKPDVSGRTALHWAVDNKDHELANLLLEHGADPNAYTRAGMPVLAYPVLRSQDSLKQLLYQHGAKLNFAYDFIYAKLIGHRFSLTGDVDIVTVLDEFIELDYEGFILEFTVALLNDSLYRFTSSYSTKHLRNKFPYLYPIMDAIRVSEELLRLQHYPQLNAQHFQELEALLQHSPMLILPAASRGHAMGFVHYGPWWAKIDRGENSLKEGSINIYRMTKPEALTVDFIVEFLYQKQPRRYFHELINQHLGLEPFAKIPMSHQTAGNCSWANIQAVVPVAYALQLLEEFGEFEVKTVLDFYDTWTSWDQDRALDELIQQFYQAEQLRQASLASILGGILFQACDYAVTHHVERAEKILKILMLPEYHYILQSYLDIYCVKQFTRKGNNLLKILDDCGINPDIGVTPIATGLKE